MNGIIFELEEKSKYTGRYMDGEISYNNTSIDYTKEIRECDRKSEIKDLLNDPCLGKIFEKGEVDDEIIYNGIINREGDMGCIYGISAYGEITSEEVPIWTSVCGEDKSKYVRLATEEEKKSFAERIANTENLKKAGIIKQYLSKYEYLLDGQKKYDFKPFDQVLVRASNLGNWNLHLFARVREEEYKYECLGGLRYKECIPYQGNEHLLGTNKSK